MKYTPELAQEYDHQEAKANARVLGTWLLGSVAELFKL